MPGATDYCLGSQSHAATKNNLPFLAFAGRLPVERGTERGHLSLLQLPGRRTPWRSSTTKADRVFGGCVGKQEQATALREKARKDHATRAALPYYCNNPPPTATGSSCKKSFFPLSFYAPSSDTGICPSPGTLPPCILFYLAFAFRASPLPQGWVIPMSCFTPWTKHQVLRGLCSGHLSADPGGSTCEDQGPPPPSFCLPLAVPGTELPLQLGTSSLSPSRVPQVLLTSGIWSWKCRVSTSSPPAEPAVFLP